LSIPATAPPKHSWRETRAASSVDPLCHWILSEGALARSATFGCDVGLISEAAIKDSDGTRGSLRDARGKIKRLPSVDDPISYLPLDHTGQNFHSIAVGKLVDSVSVLAN